MTAVVNDFPRKSHFRCDYLESLSTYNVSSSWLDLWYTTYIVLTPGTDPVAFEKKLQQTVLKYVGPEAQKLLGVPIEQFLQQGNTYAYLIQPFSSIYLHSLRHYGIDPNTEWSDLRTSDVVYVWMFGTIAVLILLLAVINFMNLATAKSERRAREVGIRKTFGSNRFALVKQFIGEAVLMSFLAMVLAMGLLSITLPLFNNLVERDLQLVLISDYYTVPLLLGFVLVVGILAGSYPAFYLSSFRPALVLKGVDADNRKSMLRSSLVIVQFAISICLLIGTVVISRQLDFIQHKNLGFIKEQLVSINNAGVLGEKKEAFRNELLKDPKIISVTTASRMFGSGVPGTGYLFDKKTGTDPLPCQFVDVDYDFLNTFQIPLKEGRFFSREFPSDAEAVLLNESAVKMFLAEDPVGKELVTLDRNNTGRSYKIIGVISDFNYESLHTEVRPLILHLHTPRQPAVIMTIRITPDDINGTISRIEEKWKRFKSGETIYYSFVDDTLNRLYITEQKIRLVSAIFSGLAIFIACIGLFGLAAFVTEQRTKEIGIRKVLGASSAQIITLLSKEFALWVMISNLLAWPAAYLVMSDWLNNFAYRISMPLSAFVSAGLIAFSIAFLTVGLLAYRAAGENPVKSLKYE